MHKLNRAQLRLLLLSLFIVIVAILFFFLYGNHVDNNSNEVIIDDLKKQNQENIIKAQSYKAPSLRAIDENDVYVGDLNNDVEIIVYEDYSNNFSAKYKESLDKLISEYGDRVVLAFRPFAVNSNGLSSEANQAVYCAHDQNKYLSFREEVFNRLNESNLYESDLYDIASNLSLHKEDFSKCLKSNKYLAKLNNLREEANDFGVFGAPTTFVENDLVIGARAWQNSIDSNGEQIDGLSTIIEKHLSK